MNKLQGERPSLTNVRTRKLVEDEIPFCFTPSELQDHQTSCTNLHNECGMCVCLDNGSGLHVMGLPASLYLSMFYAICNTRPLNDAVTM